VGAVEKATGVTAAEKEKAVAVTPAQTVKQAQNDEDVAARSRWRPRTEVFPSGSIANGTQYFTKTR
jgi:hypothetical protein